MSDMSSVPRADFGRLIESVARQLWGDPNPRLSKGGELRWGAKGARIVFVESGRFYDAESEETGGTLDLIKRELRCEKADALAFLENQGLIEPRQSRTPDLRQRGIFYDYEDANGVTRFRVERRGKGQNPPFLQYAPDGHGGFKSHKGCMANVELIPYGLPQLLAATSAQPDEIIYVCEGEKDADRLISCGMTATTNPGGAGKWTPNFSAYLRGCKVIVLQDNDDAGLAHAQKVFASVSTTAVSAAVLRLPGLREKGDVSDWLDAGHTVEQLKELARAALAIPTERSGPAEPPTSGLDESAALLPYIDAGSLEGKEVPTREWMLEGWEPRRSCVYLTGLGASGKSLLTQQRMTCSAIGKPFLGVEVTQGISIYISCEDDLGEMHRRQDAINKVLGITWADLRGKLYLVSLKGQLNKELAVFDAEGRMALTERWHGLGATIEKLGAVHVALDNVAHLFSGNENIRNHVAAFVGLLDGLAERIDGVVLLLGHPNKAGQEYSGSTAWENQVRARLFLKADDEDPDNRILTNSKPNYSRRGEELKFRWHDWGFIRPEDMSADLAQEIAATAAQSIDDEIFLTCLRTRTTQWRAVSDRHSPTYAPNVFAEMPEAKKKGVTKSRLEAAMERLFRNGAIERAQLWKGADRKAVVGLRETAASNSRI